MCNGENFKLIFDFVELLIPYRSKIGAYLFYRKLADLLHNKDDEEKWQ